MGPSTGSPAAETHKRIGRFSLPGSPIPGGGIALSLFIGTLLLFGLPGTAGAASVDDTRTLTVVVVVPSLSLTEDSDGSPLAFDQAAAGATSEARVVNYQLYSNNQPAAALDGLLTARISGPNEGIELLADVERFVNQGTPGNIELREHSSGFQEVGAAPVPLADKGATQTPKALNGSIPIRWKATTAEHLSAGKYPVTLTVTLKDS